MGKSKQEHYKQFANERAKNKKHCKRETSKSLPLCRTCFCKAWKERLSPFLGSLPFSVEVVLVTFSLSLAILDNKSHCTAVCSSCVANKDCSPCCSECVHVRVQVIFWYLSELVSGHFSLKCTFWISSPFPLAHTRPTQYIMSSECRKKPALCC